MMVIEDLVVHHDTEELLKGVTLSVKPGELHVIMGENGSGKSTLLNTIMGSPHYKVISGSITLNGNNLTELSPEKRAQSGVFLAFQNPVAIPGVLFGNMVRLAYNSLNPDAQLNPRDFVPLFEKNLEAAGLERSFLGRSVNEGFSGGERKKAELAQMLTLKPSLVLLDEIDSGLDEQSVARTAELLQEYRQETGATILVVSHQASFIQSLNPDCVHRMEEGKIVSSTPSL